MEGSRVVLRCTRLRGTRVVLHRRGLLIRQFSDVTPRASRPLLPIWSTKASRRGEGPATTRTVSIGLEQLVSIKRSKTRISGEVLDDFGTFFRAHDAMKG